MQYKLEWLVSAIAVCLAGCSVSKRTCEKNSDCPGDQICRYDQCLERKFSSEPESKARDAGVGTADTTPASEETGATGSDTEPASADVEKTMSDTEPSVRRIEAPAELQFDGPETEKTVELTNIGNASVTLTGRTITGNVFSVFSVRYRSRDGEQEAELPVQLAPGETLVVAVRYTSTEAGNDRSKLQFESNADEAPTEIELAGRTEGCLEVPETLDFGAVPIDTTESGVLSVRNCGERAAFEFEASLVEDDDAFSIRPPGKLTLSPGESYAISISVDPDGEFRSLEGRVLIETNIPGRERVNVEVTADVLSTLLPTRTQPLSPDPADRSPT